MASAVKQAVIMVGGKGTRLRPLTDTRPKPILPVLDKPCLRYLIESLVDAGIREIILACGYRSEQLSEAIGDGSDLGIKIIYSYEDEPLGTAGAMKLIEDDLDEIFVAANGDTFADIDVRGEIMCHFENDAGITIALTRVKNPCEFGIARLDDKDRILEFKEKPKPEEVFSDLVNAGIYVVDKTVLSIVPESGFYDFSKDLLPQLMNRGMRIQGYLLEGTWRDVGRPMDLIGANLAMAANTYNDYIWGGKALEDTEIRKPFYMGQDCSISKSQISASVVSAGCEVVGSRISNSLLMKGCVVESAVVENSILGEGCTVCSGAHLTNAVLGDGTVVESGEIVDGTPKD